MALLMRDSGALIALLLATLVAASGCDRSDEAAAPAESAQAAAAPTAAHPLSAERPTWSMFRGDRSQTGVAPGSLTLPLELRWFFETTASIASSPVVADGLAFIGSDDGFLYAVHVADGSLAWKFATEDAIEAPPMVLEGVVYAGSSDYRLYALDAATGAERWRFETDEKVLSGANWFEAPDGARRIVFGSYDNFLYCLDAASGELVWKYETGNYVNGTPAIEGDRIVFGGCDSVLHVVSAAEGKARHAWPLGEECFVAGSVGIVGGAAYFGHYGNAFECRDLESGETRWSYANERHPFFSAPAISADRVWFGGRDRQVHCLNRATGEVLWTFPTKRQVDSSPVLCDGKIIVGSGDGLLYVLDAATGSEVWSYDLGKSIVSSPAVVDGIVLIGCNDGRLYAFGPPRPEPGP